MDIKFYIYQILGVTAIFALAALIAWMLRKHTAASRHLVWWLATLAALALPATSLWKPAALPTVVLAPAQTRLVVATSAPLQQQSAWTSTEVLTTAWLVGFSVLAIRLMFALIHLVLRRRASTRFPVAFEACEADVRLSNRISVPETFGFFRPVVLLPVEASGWPADRLRAVLAHERIHIQRRDWVTQMIAQITVCFYWFHPLAWLALSQIRKESELACDDGVLQLGYRNSEYAQHLVDVASGIRSDREALSPSIAMAARSHLETRVRNILNPTMNRGNVTTMMKLAALICTLMAVVLFSGNGLAAGESKIYGTVTDASGAVIPDASVTLARTSPPRNTVATVTSPSGEWAFAAVEPGDYNLEVKTPGFRVYQQRLGVAPGTPLAFTIRLDVGSIQESITVQGETSTPLARSSGPVQRVRVGGNVQPAKLIARIPPEYPQHLKDAGISGAVVLQAVIGREGQILEIRPISPDVNKELVDAAVRAVSQWKYAPTMLNGVNVEVVTTITVNFALSHRG